MIEIRVNLGAFEMTLGELLDLREGQVYRWAISENQKLDLLVGEEKIAQAILVTENEDMFLQVVEVC